MTNLHFDITGDCSSAIAALSNTESAADRLSRMNPSLGLSVTGTDKAISQLSAVGAAATAASGMVSVGADTRGIVAAQSEVSSLSGGVRGLAQDLGALSGVGGGGLRDMDEGVQGLSRSMAGSTSMAGRFSQAIGDVLSSNAPVVHALYDGAGGMQKFGDEAEVAGSKMQAATVNAREFAEVQNAVRSGGTPGGMFGGGSGGGFGGGGRGRGFGGGPPGGYNGPPLGVPGTPDGPPSPPGEGAGARGASEGMHGLGQPLMMGAAIGGVESLVTGAAGFMAVNEAIKHTPDLAYAANGAMQQFGKGIRSAASSAIAEGVPALHALRGVMKNFGVEVGGLGAEHMGTAIAGVSDLASVATESLKKLDPAVESSMKGLVGLGEAVMNGIASPAVVTALKNVGDALSDPKNEQGIQSLVSGLSTVSGIAAKVAVDVGGAVGNLTGLGGDAVTPALQSGLGVGMMTKSPLMGGLVGLATLQAQQEEAAGRSDLVTPGVAGGAAGAFGGHTLGKGMGLKGGKLGALTAGGYLLGDVANVAATAGDKAAGTGSLMSDMAEFGTAGATIGAFGGPWGAAGGLLIGAGVGFAKNMLSGDDSGADGSKGFAPGATKSDMAQAGRYGWQQDTDAKGNTTMRPGTAGDRASNTHLEAVRHAQGMASGGNAMPSLAHGGSKPDDSGTRVPGFSDLFKGGLAPGSGSGMRVLPQSAVQQLNQASSGMQQLAQTTSSVAPPMQQIGQQATQSGFQMSQMAQHTQAQAAAIQHLNQVTSPTMNSLQQMPQQANTAMSQAQSSMVSGGNQMGRSMPQSVSQGINSGQSQVCDASKQMMQGAANCASSAGGIQSPSTVFTYFGQMLGAGLAQGISGSSGMAAGAAGAAMMNVADVAANYAGNAGLNLGTVFGTNLVSGINTTIKSSALKSTGLAQGVDSPLAKMALGQLGLLGKAGSGAQSWDLLNNAGVASFGSGTPANSSPPPTIPPPQVFVQIGNHALDPHILQVSTRNFEELAAALVGVRR